MMPMLLLELVRLEKGFSWGGPSYMLGVGGWVLLLFFIFMFCIGGTHKVTSHAVLFVDRTVNGQVYVT